MEQNLNEKIRDLLDKVQERKADRNATLKRKKELEEEKEVISKECVEKFGLEIDDLKKSIDSMEKELTSDIDELEKLLA